MSNLGVHENLGGDKAGTVTPTDLRDILCHRTLRSVYELGEEERKGALGVVAFVFPSSRYAGWSPLAQGGLNTRL